MRGSYLREMAMQIKKILDTARSLVVSGRNACFEYLLFLWLRNRMLRWVIASPQEVEEYMYCYLHVEIYGIERVEEGAKICSGLWR